MSFNTVVAIASDLRRCLMGLSPISQVSQAVISICTKYIGPLVKSLAATGKNHARGEDWGVTQNVPNTGTLEFALVWRHMDLNGSHLYGA